MRQTPAPHALELTSAEMRRLVDAAAERAIAHVATLGEQPASDTSDAERVARALIEPPPQHGEPAERLLDRLFTELVPKSFNCAGPGYLAYIPGGGLFQSAVADLVAASINRYVTVWAAAPALAQLEATVVRWFCDMVGYPADAGGFLSSGGSIANLSGLVTARSEKLGEDLQGGTAYASDQIHHSVLKAAAIAGIPRRNVRAVDTDELYRIRVDVLRQRIREDRAAGLRPFLIVASAGTTNTGAVDDLATLADLARDEGLWLHVDAAYGGFFLLTHRGRLAMRGIERADSITLDPHKGLFVPYGTGCLIAKDRAALARAHTGNADYMPSREHAPEFVDFCDLSPELSRAFRGLRVWLPLKMHGLPAFRTALDEKLDLARWAAAELASIPGIEIVAEPQLTVVAFRLAPPALDRETTDMLNRELLERINARKRVMLTGTVVDRGFVLRICVVSFRTHLDRMQMCLEDVRAAIGGLAPEL